MGRGDLAGLAFGEVGGWGEAGKGSVWPMVVVEVLEAVEDGVEGFEGGGQVIGLVELVAPGAVAALDGSAARTVRERARRGVRHPTGPYPDQQNLFSSMT